MGGRALASIGIETVRLNKEDFSIVSQIIESEFNELGWYTHIVKSYENKETFGYLDILLLNNNPELTNKLKTDIEKVFHTRGIVKNANVNSFEYKNFQIDAIVINPEDWETSIGFFDYDPSGNIMGKVAHKFGLKYGAAGLVYPYRTETSHIMKDIIISKDNFDIFSFLGYDYSEYLQGFNNLEDIFIYLTNGAYFDPFIFKYENLNHIDKKRNRKRSSYNEFLEYINLKGIHINDGVIWEDKLLYLDYINKFFPNSNFLQQYFELKYKEKIHNTMSDKFNGDLIMGLFPDLYGKLLGKFITEFKSQYVFFDEFIIQNDIETIKKHLMEHYKKNYNNI